MDNQTTFGTYSARTQVETHNNPHFCVDFGRRTVDGKHLSWLWVFPLGKVGQVNKVLVEEPTYIWTKQHIITAYNEAGNPDLVMWTRHVEKYSELAITFCLPFPDVRQNGCNIL
ncbi:hypothetical protein FKG94_16260 [Exilibacterium tricleocarpae]|uniref:Uncharacterized protein n=1 Tax=Exilibacterium tricleocarpae TaxID=2591008 RepID=A0A545TAB8_9GAMM|nr:hypothetical protein FKG94_16260 [Exilibacterium tricleocarpae]